MGSELGLALGPVAVAATFTAAAVQGQILRTYCLYASYEENYIIFFLLYLDLYFFLFILLYEKTKILLKIMFIKNRLDRQQIYNDAPYLRCDHNERRLVKNAFYYLLLTKTNTKGGPFITGSL
ncbi:hypothetical protein ACJX0J_015607 [Zea mays]